MLQAIYAYLLPTAALLALCPYEIIARLVTDDISRQIQRIVVNRIEPIEFATNFARQDGESFYTRLIAV